MHFLTHWRRRCGCSSLALLSGLHLNPAAKPEGVCCRRRWVASVVSDSVRPHGLRPTRLPRPLHHLLKPRLLWLESPLISARNLCLMRIKDTRSLPSDKLCAVLRQCYCTLNIWQYSVNITFLCTGKAQKNVSHFGYSLYWVIWNQTYSISEVCLNSLSGVQFINLLLSIKSKLLVSYVVQWVIFHYSHYLLSCLNCFAFGQWELL